MRHACGRWDDGIDRDLVAWPCMHMSVGSVRGRRTECARSHVLGGALLCGPWEESVDRSVTVSRVRRRRIINNKFPGGGEGEGGGGSLICPALLGPKGQIRCLTRLIVALRKLKPNGRSSPSAPYPSPCLSLRSEMTNVPLYAIFIRCYSLRQKKII
jgi:hypothetical protein